MTYDPAWSARAGSAADVVAHVRSGARVFVHGAAATPIALLDALAARTDLEGVRLYHLHTAGTASFVAPGVSDRLRSVSFFVGPDLRTPIAEGRADFMPIFLSDIPALFTTNAIPLDVALVQLSPPDRHGLMSLGTSADAARAAVDSAKIVLAEINDRMPRSHGNTVVPLERVHAFVRTNRALPEAARAPETEIGSSGPVGSTPRVAAYRPGWVSTKSRNARAAAASASRPAQPCTAAPTASEASVRASAAIRRFRSSCLATCLYSDVVRTPTRSAS